MSYAENVAEGRGRAMKLAGDMWKKEPRRARPPPGPNWSTGSLPAGRASPARVHPGTGPPGHGLPPGAHGNPLRRDTGPTYDTKLDLRRVTILPAATTAVDASVLCPQGTDDQGAIRLQLVPE